MSENKSEMRLWIECSALVTLIIGDESMSNCFETSFWSTDVK